MKCPGCESARAERLWEVGDRLFRTTQERFQIARCQACGLLFLSPTPSDVARHYPEGYWSRAEQEEVARGLRLRLREIYRRLVLSDHVRFVRRVVNEQRKRGGTVTLLDVGCGDGSFLAASGDHRSIGLDSSPTALRAARARGLAVIQSDLLRSPFPERSFSLITMFHFLEHVSPPQTYLAAARRLLADDGELVVQVPNAASWQARLLGPRWSGFDVPRHLVNYSVETLRATLASAGFCIVREKQFSLRDNAAALATSLAPALYPPARDARTTAASGLAAWLSDLAYFALTLGCLPFSLAESLFARGATIMVQAKKVLEAA